MRFSRLRLLGFKSFVEPSEFVIEGGLTGVVGPNGCGKSNLVEALRWVMGENSYKNMRASGMDDVIFSGSGTRPARNTAEVTLFLDNSARKAPAAYNDSDELQVSRRIEREAGSVYRINGKEVRAKDVQLLFADQSTGARSPSMVGQGRIGELIQARPQARRALLEEAAGISGLHTRRHEAELRLRAAEQNLERLEDVVGELESQIESLRRQSRQAARFKSLSADIRQSEAILLHLRWKAAKEQEAEAQSALSAATALVAGKAQAQMNAAKEQAVGAMKLPDLRETEAKAAAALQRLGIARTQLEEEAKRLQARHGELTRRLEQLEADIAREDRMVRDNAETLERLEAEEAELAQEQDGAARREAQVKSEVEAAQAALTQSEAALAAVTAERAEALAVRAQAERALAEHAQRAARLDQQLGQSRAEAETLSTRLAALPDPAEKRAILAEAESAVAASEAEFAAAEASVADARRAESTLRQPLQDARSSLARLEAEHRTLAGVLNAASGGLFPAVLEQISVDKGYEAALGAALGEDLDLPLDRSAPAHWGGIAPAPDDPALPSGVEPLAGRVRAPSQLARRLAQIGLVEKGEGATLQPSLRPGQRLVSREGALWRWDGYTASADAPTPAALRLAQKNRLAELEAEISHAAAAVAEAEAAVQAAGTRLAAASSAELVARDRVKLADRQRNAAREDLARAERATGELLARRAAIQEGLERQVEEAREAHLAREQAEAERAAVPDPAEIETRFSARSAVVAVDRQKFADARAALDGLAREAAMRSRRLQTIASDRAAWLARAENAAQQIEALAARKDETSNELATLADLPDEFEERRRALLNQISDAEKARKASADVLVAAEAAQAVLDRAAQDAIHELAASREARARSEERLQAAEDRRKEAEARIAETLNVAPHLAIRHAGLQPGDADPDIAEVERRIDRLRIERERLGAVNLRAEEEQKELSERLETIVREREDIIEAIRKLRQAILSLNREGRERLLAAFGEVNAHFQRLFSHLFGGGTAELQLIESDDPLEAGLEILARPPGKKPQTMTLLSGGEQALTAMALIFAVFLTNPAPICVLDEVDAPLDDHNVERFCNLMDEMAATTETRFVIITHNPITMARMNRLFGVTMAEQGVSQLVSVDLQTAERIREAS